MNIILDSNVFFSALIKNSITRKIILEYEGLFLFPSYIFIEIQNHKKELLEKSGMSEYEFTRLIRLLLLKIVIVPHEALVPFKEKAVEIVKDIDLDDVLFVACALAYPNSIIWSNDQKLKKQPAVRIINTAEMLEFLEGK
ncbi:PIN domain-containing protein [Candidatus Woesearchaeota archaeon]|nr:PIN domain-containing protein [Candidatus Woesearchaeota archaeon]